MTIDLNEQEIKTEEEKQILHEKSLEDGQESVDNELKDLTKNTEDEITIMRGIAKYGYKKIRKMSVFTRFLKHIWYRSERY